MVNEESKLEVSLYENYGIQLSRWDTTEQELLKNGYHKIPDVLLEKASRTSGLVSSFFIDYVRGQNVNNVIKQLSEGTFRVVCPKVEEGIYKINDVYLTPSKKVKGAITTQVRTKDGNVLVDQAVLMPTEAGDMTMIQIADIAQKFINLAAFSVGQYFMTQINGKLMDIKKDLQEVMQFLDNEKMSALEAAYDELCELYNHLEYIKYNEVRVNTSIERIKQVNYIARKDIHFFKRQIVEITNKASVRDKRDDVNDRVQSLIQTIMRYRLSLAIFCEAKLIDIYLADVRSIDELLLFSEEMKRVTEDFIKDYKNVRTWCNDYLINHRIIGSSNKMSFVDSIDGYLKREEGENGIESRFNGMTKKMLERFKEDPDDLFLSVKSLERYISVLQNNPEFCFINRNVYTKIPIDELAM